VPLLGGGDKAPNELQEQALSTIPEEQLKDEELEDDELVDDVPANEDREPVEVLDPMGMAVPVSQQVVMPPASPSSPPFFQGAGKMLKENFIRYTSNKKPPGKTPKGPRKG